MKPMLKIILIILLITISSCFDNYSPNECPGEKDFKIINQDFNAYHLFRRHENLYSFITNFDMKIVDIDIMKSSDNGFTWKRLCKIESDTSTPLYVLFNSLEDFMETNDGSYWIITTGFKCSGCLYKSTNKGISWELQDIKINSKSIHFYYKAMHLNKNGTIFLFDFWKGIICSKDNGISWEYIVNESTAYDYVQFFDDNIFYYQRDRDLMVSYDEGNTWVKTDGIDIKNMEYPKGYSMSMIEGENSSLYFSICLSDSNEYFLYQSSDNGKSWTGTKNYLDKSYMTIEKLIGANKNGDLYAFISENNYSSFCYDYEGVFKSTDGGKNWEHLLYMPANLSLITEDNHVLFIEYQDILKITKAKLF